MIAFQETIFNGDADIKLDEESDVAEIAAYFCFAPIIRPLRIDFFSETVSDLIKKYPLNKEFRKKITFFSMNYCPALYYRLYENGVAKLKFNFIEDESLFLIKSLIYFLDSIDFIRKIPITRVIEELEGIFLRLGLDNSEKRKEYILYCYTKDSLQYLLKYDLIEELKIRSSLEFNFNQKLSKSFFDFTNISGEFSLLEFSSFYGSVGSFRYLLLNGAIISPRIAEYAVQSGEFSIIHQLPDLYPKDVFSSLYSYQNEVTDWLVENGCNLNFPLRFCFNIKGIIKLIDTMEMKNMDTSKLLCFTMINFSKFGSINMIKYLHSKGVDISYSNSCRDTPLFISCEYGLFHFCKYLLDNGADMYYMSLNGLLPIHKASEKGFVKIVELFLEKGCDINARSSMFATPLICAARGSHLKMVKFLLEKGADVSMIDSSLFSPLHMACFGHNLDIVKQLIIYGSELNNPNHNLQTPLHNAAIVGSTEIYQYLIEQGADVNAKDKRNRTPSLIAREREKRQKKNSCNI